MHSWKHCQERHLKNEIRRCKILSKVNSDYKIKYPNEARAASKGDYTELVIRVKKDYAKYLKNIEVPIVERPSRMNRNG